MRASIDTDSRWDGPAGEVDESPEAPSVTVADEVDSASIRSWVVRGLPPGNPNARRRRGGHTGARQLLATDQRWLESPVGIWQDFVAAIHRQTAHAALARLDESDRKILMMAYVQGRTNSEIAALLQVSLSTVGRRLSKALAKLEAALGHVATWTSAMVLLGITFIARRGGPERALAYRNVASVAAGAAATLTVAMLVTGPSPVAAPAVPNAGPGIAIRLPAVAAVRFDAHPTGSAAIEAPAATVQPAAATTSTVENGSASSPIQAPPASRPGCHGNPTSAAPTVPVGPRGTHPAGPPVSHPGPGVCGPG